MRLTEKTCSKCKQTKPTDAFYRRPKHQFKLSSYCKECQKGVAKEIANRLVVAKRQAEVREMMEERSPEGDVWLAKKLLAAAKARAKYQGIEFSLTLEDIHIPHVCPALGIPLQKGKGSLHAGSPTLDRIDNTKGYVKGNVHVISSKANTMKSNATIQEMRQLLEWMETL